MQTGDLRKKGKVEGRPRIVPRERKLPWSFLFCPFLSLCLFFPPPRQKTANRKSRTAEPSHEKMEESGRERRKKNRRKEEGDGGRSSERKGVRMVVG